MDSLWTVVDIIGYLMGPLWPDWLDGWIDELADLTSSVPDIYDACGVGCVVVNYVDHVLIAVNHYYATDFLPCLPWLYTCAGSY